MFYQQIIVRRSSISKTISKQRRPLLAEDAVAQAVIIDPVDNARLAEARFFAETELLRQMNHAVVARPRHQPDAYDLRHCLEDVVAPDAKRFGTKALPPGSRIVEDNAHVQPIRLFAVPIPTDVAQQLVALPVGDGDPPPWRRPILLGNRLRQPFDEPVDLVLCGFFKVWRVELVPLLSWLVPGAHMLEIVFLPVAQTDAGADLLHFPLLIS